MRAPQVCSADGAQEVHTFIRGWLASMYDQVSLF